MHQYRAARRWVGYFLFFFLIAGCSLTGQKPDIVREEKEADQAYSNLEVRQMVVDHPHLMSGDYFRKRTDQDKQTAALADILPGSEADAVESGKSGKSGKPGSLENEAPRSAGLAESAAYRLKIGFFLDPRDLPASNAGRLIQAADQSAGSHMILINDTGMQEVIASTDCPKAEDVACIAESAALYPGVRMLVMMKEISLPDEFPAAGRIRFKVMDAALGYSYPEIEIADRIEKAPLAGEFLKNAMSRVFDYAHRKAQVMPQHCRVFNIKNDRVYINAGSASGLKEGAVLPFVNGGEVISSPNGFPVAWMPGEIKGKLQVADLVGSDLACCRLVGGEMPDQGAYVLVRDF